MARYSKDRGARSISIGPAIAATSPLENAGTTPKNPGNATGTGDEFVYIPAGPGGGYQYPVNITWDISVSGGVLTALVVALELSDDGVNWTSVDTQSSTTGGRKTVANQIPRYCRLDITTYTVSSGTPIVTGGITC